MTDEEKKAIKKVKYICDKWYDENLEIDVKWLESLLSLCEKQSKEIEELKEKNKPQPDCAEPIERTEEMVNMRWVNHRFISKDKLKEILGIEETDSEKILSLLQTIVDENNRLEDIEDRKVQIEYNNVFNKGVKSVEDKIKTKIEILRKQEKEEPDAHLGILILESILKEGDGE